MTDSLNDKVESPSRQTGSWGFVGYLQVAKNQEQRTPIGVFTDYTAGKAVANAWMQNTGRAIRWEAEQLHAPLEEVAEVTPYPAAEDVSVLPEDPEPAADDEA